MRKLAMANATIINLIFTIMKNLGIFCLLLACIGLQSCKKNEVQKELKSTEIQAEGPISVQCYKALYEQDTVDLKINTLKDGKVTGDMVMKIIDMPQKTGTISGSFKGDTLFIDYSFFQGTYEKKIFKNPMALLKRNEELILGSGKIETYLGKSYFVKDVPLDFENVKYKFKIVDCVEK